MPLYMPRFFATFAEKHGIMKQLLLILALCAFAIQVNAQSISSQSDSIKQWTAQWQKQYINDRENPTKWDSAHYKEDLDGFPKLKQEPIVPGIFPVPNYDLYPGTFDGIVAANFDLYLPSGQRITCVVNGNAKTSLNQSMIGDNDVDYYFILAVVTDCPPDTVTYDDVNISGFSRNHPDVISEGYVRTSDSSKVDFVAFRAANNDAYAIVNMRLFNLHDGNIVIIVPQEDGSLRSMQIQPEKLLTFQTLRQYITTLLTDNERVNRFVTVRNDEFSRQNPRLHHGD